MSEYAAILSAAILIELDAATDLSSKLLLISPLNAKAKSPDRKGSARETT